ncbi:hypothetical protein [Nocardia sp. NPDC059239]|uniref:hypothetical protein n=1 Tax=unclassified Nocardia TaxID=2637762 RepID=UPI0036C25001
MSIFSKVGTCDQLATRSVEGFSPRDGRAHGSLDAYVYVCDDHIQTAGDEWLGDLPTTFVNVTRPSDGTVCGRMVDFRRGLGVGGAE